MTNIKWSSIDDYNEEKRQREVHWRPGWSLLILAIVMIAIGLAGIATGHDTVNGNWFYGLIDVAHAQTMTANNTALLDRTDHYYSNPVITFRTSNITVIHPGQNETIAASCNDNNSLPYAGGWKMVKPGGILTILESYPDVAAHAWNITAMNIGSEPVSIIAVVTCIHDSSNEPTELPLQHQSDLQKLQNSLDHSLIVYGVV